MSGLDVVAVGELNPDLILGGMTRFPQLGREKFLHLRSLYPRSEMTDD